MKNLTSIFYDFSVTNKENRPVGYDPLSANFDPRTEPKITPPMSRVINMPNGITNLFLEYQGCLEDVMKNCIQRRAIKKAIRLTGFSGRVEHLNVQIFETNH